MCLLGYEYARLVLFFLLKNMGILCFLFGGCCDDPFGKE
jgi:hypothetical protein